ncbi:MAG: hypothetical protein ACQESK_07670 [Bacteroidota bacterium]
MNKKLLTYFVVFFIVFNITSCNRILFNFLINDKVKAYEYYNEKEDAAIIAFAMAHINTPEYYQQIKDSVLNLKDAGYTLYYEGVGLDKGTDSLTIDTLVRKFRKVTGFHVFSEGAYLDPDNKTIPAYFKKEKFISQTPFNTGVDTTQDIRADLTLNQLIKSYEERYQAIELDDCDFETPFQEKYECETKGNSFSLISTLREEYLKRVIDSLKHQKIVLLYGGSHHKFLYPYFLDKGYEPQFKMPFRF